jgi:hypothetical protein
MDGAPHSFWIYWKYAASASETFGTRTGTTHCFCVALRSSDGFYLDLGSAYATGQVSSTTVNYPAILSNALGYRNHRVFGVGCTTVNTSTIETAPSLMSNVGGITGATDGELVLHATSASVASWASTNTTVGSAIRSRSVVFGIAETDILISTGGGGASAYGYFG